MALNLFWFIRLQNTAYLSSLVWVDFIDHAQTRKECTSTITRTRTLQTS